MMRRPNKGEPRLWRETEAAYGLAVLGGAVSGDRHEA
jgi:hypothetical protein